MSTKRFTLIIVALIIIAVALVITSAALAKKPPCPEGWQLWWHELGNGRVECECFQKAKPPRNSEWKRGCPAQPPDEPGPVETEEPGPVETEEPEPVETDHPPFPDPDSTHPAPDPRPRSAPGDDDFAKFTRLGVKEYQQSPGGSITVWWIGTPEAVRLCTHSMECRWIEPPVDWQAVNLRETRGTLVLGDGWAPGAYFLYANSRNGTGNGGEGKTKLIIK